MNDATSWFGAFETMSEQSDGDHAQIRLIARQLVKAAVIEVNENQPSYDVPKWLQWAGGILAGVVTAMVTAGCLWTVSTLSDMKTSMATVEARLGPNGSIEAKMTDYGRRIDRLEAQRATEK